MLPMAKTQACFHITLALTPLQQPPPKPAPPTAPKPPRQPASYCSLLQPTLYTPGRSSLYLHLGTLVAKLQPCQQSAPSAISSCSPAHPPCKFHVHMYVFHAHSAYSASPCTTLQHVLRPPQRQCTCQHVEVHVAATPCSLAARHHGLRQKDTWRGACGTCQSPLALHYHVQSSPRVPKKPPTRPPYGPHPQDTRAPAAPACTTPPCTVFNAKTLPSTQTIQVTIPVISP